MSDGSAPIDWREKQTHALPKGTFTVDRRYHPIKVIGIGAYGIVCVARDELTGKLVAIKKIIDVFRQPTIAKRTLREIKLLRHFNRHENVIAINSVMYAGGDSADVYVVTDLLGGDLHRIIHSQQELTEEHARYFLYQILRGLKFIHSANVLHRDIKPSNLLVTSDCDLQICDFGMARGIASNEADQSGFMTAYVATRWYRAPEVLLSMREYTTSVDMWSVGCVFAEMLGRRYLFPGSNYVEQLNMVFNVLGSPSMEYCEQAGSELAVKYLKRIPHMNKIPLSQIYPNASAEAVDLLEKMLVFEPAKRITVVDALKHPFLCRYHNPAEEPTCKVFNFDFDRDDLTLPQLKELILEEIKDYESSAALFSSCLGVALKHPHPASASSDTSSVQSHRTTASTSTAQPPITQAPSAQYQITPPKAQTQPLPELAPAPAFQRQVTPPRQPASVNHIGSFIPSVTPPPAPSQFNPIPLQQQQQQSSHHAPLAPKQSTSFSLSQQEIQQELQRRLLQKKLSQSQQEPPAGALPTQPHLPQVQPQQQQQQQKQQHQQHLSQHLQYIQSQLLQQSVPASTTQPQHLQPQHLPLQQQPQVDPLSVSWPALNSAGDSFPSWFDPALFSGNALALLQQGASDPNEFVINEGRISRRASTADPQDEKQKAPEQVHHVAKRRKSVLNPSIADEEEFQKYWQSAALNVSRGKAVHATLRPTATTVNPLQSQNGAPVVEPYQPPNDSVMRQLHDTSSSFDFPVGPSSAIPEIHSAKPINSIVMELRGEDLPPMSALFNADIDMDQLQAFLEMGADA